MKHISTVVLLFTLALPATGESGQMPHAALAAFKTGQFERAADLAQRDGDADALSLAARALLAKGMCGTGQPSEALLSEAEQLARDAVALDPDHVEARLQLAIALSLQARPMSTREALRSGLGDTARDLAKEVLRDDPSNAYSHGLLAVWHIEVVRRGGSFGSAMMGASVRKGLTHYREAAALQPGDASIHWQVARALTALDARKYREEIDAALAEAMAASTEDVLEEVMAARAGKLAAALQTQSRQDVEALAASLL